MKYMLTIAIGVVFSFTCLSYDNLRNADNSKIDISEAIESGIIPKIICENKFLDVYICVPKSLDDGSLGWLLSGKRDAFVHIGKIQGRNLNEILKVAPNTINLGESLDYWIPIYLKTENGAIIEFEICPMREWGIDNYYPAFNLWDIVWELLNLKLDIDRRVAYDCSQSYHNKFPPNYHDKTKKVSSKDMEHVF